jgi:predicted CoA-binding protein
MVFDSERLERVLRSSSDWKNNPGPDAIRTLIRKTDSIAVVGMSRDLMKPARRIPSYLSAMGAHVIGINPVAGKLLGKPSRQSLEDVVEPVDMVMIFRPSDQVGPFVRSAAARPEHPIIWLPEGVRDDVAAAEARAAGCTVVQDLCIYRVHRAMGGTLRKNVRAR